MANRYHAEIMMALNSLSGFNTGRPNRFMEAALRISQARAEPIAIFLIGLVVFLNGMIGTQVRVGDGSEYYALFYAWRDTALPFMTDAAWASYEALYRSFSIEGLVATDGLKEFFPALRLGGTADFNHFWLYSFCAAVISKMVGVIPAFGTPKMAFALLHTSLATALAALARRHYGRIGLAAVAALLFASPTLWFTDKVHTEFATVCLTTMAFILVLRHRYLPAALALAVTATQNPTFAVPAAALVLWDLARNGLFAFTLQRVLLITASAVFAVIHPLYYYFRYGVPTPQLLAGGAEFTSSNFSIAYIWFIDPDIGLLPNWPFGTFALAFALVIALFRLRDYNLRRLDGVAIAFTVIYIAVSLLAQASTQNINHGGTVHVSRYGLWYMCFFFLPLLVLFRSLFDLSAQRMGTKRWVAGMIPAALLAVISAVPFLPHHYEVYLRPTVLSRAVQTWLPTLYTPPEQIFLDRYGRYANGYNTNAGAVFGPDCRKVGYRAPTDSPWVVSAPYCSRMFDVSRLQTVLMEKYGDPGSAWRIVRLSEAEMESALMTLPAGAVLPMNAGSPFNVLLKRGWSQSEPWGTWSDGRVATITLPVAASQLPADIELDTHAFVPGGTDPLSVTLAVDGGAETEAEFPPTATAKVLHIPVTSEAVSDGTVTIRLTMDEPRSPAELGASPDSRKLGLGLVSLRLVPSPSPDPQ